VPSPWEMPWTSAQWSRPPAALSAPSPARMEELLGFLQDGGAGQDPNEGRFRREFKEVSVLGRGQFSTVYSARCVADQHAYAVKVLGRPSRGHDASKEAFALARIAARSCSPHLLRYFASWWEDGALYIQTEVCAGSLRRLLEERATSAPADPRFGEDDLVHILRDVSSGLKVLHSLDFAHLDVKPENILSAEAAAPRQGAVYKVADLGLVTPVACGSRDMITEGDCRYVAREMLYRRDFDLPKADVFSLGLVLYEAARNPRLLPRNGDEWQHLRDGVLDVASVPPLSGPMLALLRGMTHAEYAARPSTAEVAQHEAVEPDGAALPGVGRQLHRRRSVHEAVAPDDEVSALQKALKEAQAEAAHYKELAEKYERVVQVRADTFRP